MSFIARYDGTCHQCRAAIAPGDEIEYVNDRTVHVDCVDAAVFRTSSGRKDPDPCPRCFLIHAGPCDR